jgi:hypothetical protein
MKKLPIIRHIRYFLHLWAMKEHYAFWTRMGMLPVNRDRDYAQLDKIWKGDE